MSQNGIFRRLRPHLFTRYHILKRASNTRSFASSASCNSERDVTQDYKKRVAQLEAQRSSEEWYPRLENAADARWPIAKFNEELHFIEPDETLDDEDTFTVAGTTLLAQHGNEMG